MELRSFSLFNFKHARLFHQKGFLKDVNMVSMRDKARCRHSEQNGFPKSFSRGFGVTSFSERAALLSLNTCKAIFSNISYKLESERNW